MDQEVKSYILQEGTHRLLLDYIELLEREIFELSKKYNNSNSAPFVRPIVMHEEVYQDVGYIPSLDTIKPVLLPAIASIHRSAAVIRCQFEALSDGQRKPYSITYHSSDPCTENEAIRRLEEISEILRDGMFKYFRYKINGIKTKYEDK